MRRALFGERNATEIDRVEAALRRHDARIEEMQDEWSRAGGLCCPGCMFGEEYRKAAEKEERTRAWLVILLRRRGTERDLRRARALEMGAI